MNSIAVIGDSMMDFYINGDTKILPGGAALCASMCQCNLYSYVTERFLRAFPQLKANNCHVVDYMTQKVYENGNKTDFDVIENRTYKFKPVEDILIYCDYAKGALKDVQIDKSKITIVDPKFRPLDRWKGCTIFKLNRKESFNLTNEHRLSEAIYLLKKEIECEMVIITTGEFGICGLWRDEYFEYQPKVVNIQNTVGAGDSFCAALASNYRDNLHELAIVACDAATKFCTEERP